jgi:hypothetical protein
MLYGAVSIGSAQNYVHSINTKCLAKNCKSNFNMPHTLIFFKADLWITPNSTTADSYLW